MIDGWGVYEHNVCEWDYGGLIKYKVIEQARNVRGVV